MSRELDGFTITGTAAHCLANGCAMASGELRADVERLTAVLVSIGIINASGGHPDPEIDRIIRESHS